MHDTTRTGRETERTLHRRATHSWSECLNHARWDATPTGYDFTDSELDAIVAAYDPNPIPEDL